MQLIKVKDIYIVVLLPGELESDIAILDKLTSLRQKGRVAIIISGIEDQKATLKRLLEVKLH
jgi:hypothetical protein